MSIRPVRKVTAEEENFRLDPLQGTQAFFIQRDGVEPEPVGTYVVMVFEITGYDPDCDGSLMVRAKQVSRDGTATGWEINNLGLYPDTDLVVDSPEYLWTLK